MFLLLPILFQRSSADSCFVGSYSDFTDNSENSAQNGQYKAEACRTSITDGHSDAWWNRSQLVYLGVMTRPFKVQVKVPVVWEVNITTSVISPTPLAEANAPVPPVKVS